MLRCNSATKSKRKADNNTEDEFGNNKRVKLMDNESSITHQDSSIHPWLQYINDDIAHIIVDFVKLSATSLSALSLTCSRWHNQIDAILNKDIQHYLPVSYKECNRKQRNEAIERFTLLCSEASVDLQLFEFQEKPTSYNENLAIYGIPWAPQIVFVKSYGGFAIVDLNKGQVIVPFHPDAVTRAGDGIYPLCASNEKRKQVVIAATFKTADHPVDDENDSRKSDYYEWLYVYNVSNDGAVEFVTKFCVKNCYAIVSAYTFYAPPNLLLDSTGIIWHSVANDLKRFSIAQNKEIEADLDLNELSVMGMGELDTKVMLFCADYESSPISVFDTSLNKFVGDLPESESVTEGDRDQEIEMKVVVRNNLVLVTSHTNDHEIDAIYSVKPFKKIYHCTLNKGGNFVSPTGNKIAKLDMQDLDILVREGDQFHPTSWYTVENSEFKFWWIDDDKLGSFNGTKIAILAESLKCYDVPFKKRATNPCNVAMVGNTVMIADLAGKPSDCSLSIYHMKI